ncbi:MAG: HAD family hydrolase [Rhodospirillales bacterium]|nr:HAD family hydrolase [Rhodospirillales bacterium]
MPVVTGTLQAVFFDFDGVICDSVDVKTQAFDALYKSSGDDIRDAVRRYHLLHGGISRIKKIRHYEEIINGVPPDDSIVAEKAEQFARLVIDAVIASPYISGARDALDALHGQCPIFVVSGTPEPELRDIISARDLTELFAGIYGSPRKKEEILGDILTRHGLTPLHTAMIGDAMTDYDAAKATGVPFVGVAEPGYSPFPDGTIVIPDLTHLLDTLIGAQGSGE